MNIKKSNKPDDQLSTQAQSQETIFDVSMSPNLNYINFLEQFEI